MSGVCALVTKAEFEYWGIDELLLGEFFIPKTVFEMKNVHLLTTSINDAIYCCQNPNYQWVSLSRVRSWMHGCILDWTDQIMNGIKFRMLLPKRTPLRMT